MLDSDTVYSAIDAKPKSTLDLRRLQNIRSNGAASLLVDHYEEDWTNLWWVRVDGTATTVDEGVERAPGPRTAVREVCAVPVRPSARAGAGHPRRILAHLALRGR